MSKSDEKSYDKIDYRLRPAKCIERKMLCTAFRKLRPFGDVSKYRYIGFGSAYFSDFIFFHKSLFIQDMISIEKFREDKDRFEFNKPFSCITIEYGDSTNVLPKLEWDKRTILWLDYDFSLNSSILGDIRHAFSSVVNGSVVIITVDGNIRDDGGFGEKIEENELNGNQVKKKELKLKYLIKNVGKKKVPINVKDKQLNGWNISKIYRKIIENEINDTLFSRNGGRSIGNKLLYKQLFNFYYNDGTKMLTVGGILFDEGSQDKFADCHFEELYFFRKDIDPFVIKVPKLTLREIKTLEKFLPTKFNDAPLFLTEDQKEQYKSIYPYFPNFVEADL